MALRETTTLNIPTHIQTAFSNIRQAAPQFNEAVAKVEATLKWEWSRRLRTCAGKAMLRENKIVISHKLHQDHPEEAFYTVAHELAHLVEFQYLGGNLQKRGRKQVEHHSALWKQIAIAMGDNGNSKHTMKAKGNRIKRVIVEREGKEYWITLNSWNKYQQGYIYNGYKFVKEICGTRAELAEMRKEIKG
jgi:predicted SprT family Zn-dependent metalloprotease